MVVKATVSTKLRFGEESVAYLACVHPARSKLFEIISAIQAVILLLNTGFQFENNHSFK